MAIPTSDLTLEFGIPNLYFYRVATEPKLHIHGLEITNIEKEDTRDIIHMAEKFIEAVENIIKKKKQ